MATERPLMKRAQAAQPGGENFTPQDPMPHVPKELQDAVQRVAAAGMKLMYSPQMEQERQQAIDSTEPTPKRIATNVTGLMLTLDQQAKGGIPQGAIFPAGVLLANEAGTLLVQAGEQVTQQDYNEALQILYVQLGKKLQIPDDQLMQAAQGALGQGGGADNEGTEGAQPAAEETGAGEPPQGGMPPQQRGY